MVCDQLGRFDEAVPALRRVLEKLPAQADGATEYVLASRALAHALIALGRGDEAEAGLQTLRVALPDTAASRQWFAIVHGDVGLDFHICNEHAAAIRQYRTALALSPALEMRRANLLDLLARTGERAVLSDFTDSVRDDELRPYLFIACMPKSGSSFLKAALCALTGFPDQSLTYAYLQNEQELYLPHVLSAARQPVVTQQHSRATEANIQMMQGFAIRPVVLIRDLADIVLSLRDFYDTGATANTFFQPYWPKLSPAERLELIVDHVVPWYLAFYASWVAAEAAGRVEMMWMRYEDMTADKPAALARVARFYGLDFAPAQILSAVAVAEDARAATRFNAGVAGRGTKMLPDDLKARMQQLASAYRGLDFSPIGL
jgi:hypothetical protein